MPDKPERIIYKNQWTRENRDSIALLCPLGKKEEIKYYASRTGESMNAFINRAIDEAIDKEKNKHLP